MLCVCHRFKLINFNSYHVFFSTVLLNIPMYITSSLDILSVNTIQCTHIVHPFFVKRDVYIRQPFTLHPTRPTIYNISVVVVFVVFYPFGMHTSMFSSSFNHQFSIHFHFGYKKISIPHYIFPACYRCFPSFMRPQT